MNNKKTTIEANSIYSLPPSRRKFFIECPGCRKWFDTRDIKTVKQHELCPRHDQKTKTSFD